MYQSHLSTLRTRLRNNFALSLALPPCANQERENAAETIQPPTPLFYLRICLKIKDKAKIEAEASQAYFYWEREQSHEVKAQGQGEREGEGEGEYKGGTWISSSFFEPGFGCADGR